MIIFVFFFLIFPNLQCHYNLIIVQHFNDHPCVFSCNDHSDLCVFRNILNINDIGSWAFIKLIFLQTSQKFHINLPREESNKGDKSYLKVIYFYFWKPFVLPGNIHTKVPSITLEKFPLHRH